MTRTILAWHFTGDKLRDGSPIPKIGEWLEYTRPLKMCESGLHASIDPFDALQYAPGPILHRVECAGKIIMGGDKLVCSRRRIIASKDATEGLRYFARMQALSVIHLWKQDPPDCIFDWLLGGEESARGAAWSAARSAAEYAAERAACAAWIAARSAAYAARIAAWSVADSAAESAAEYTARQDFNALVKEAFDD